MSNAFDILEDSARAERRAATMEALARASNDPIVREMAAKRREAADRVAALVARQHEEKLLEAELRAEERAELAASLPEPTPKRMTADEALAELHRKFEEFNERIDLIKLDREHHLQVEVIKACKQFANALHLPIPAKFRHI